MAKTTTRAAQRARTAAARAKLCERMRNVLGDRDEIRRLGRSARKYPVIARAVAAYSAAETQADRACSAADKASNRLANVLAKFIAKG